MQAVLVSRHQKPMPQFHGRVQLPRATQSQRSTVLDRMRALGRSWGALATCGTGQAWAGFRPRRGAQSPDAPLPVHYSPSSSFFRWSRELRARGAQNAGA